MMAMITPAANQVAGIGTVPSYQAYRTLQFAFIAVPILAGADKFLNLLVDWDRYLAPLTQHMSGGHGHALLLVMGIAEIVAGIGVALRPRSFAYVVAALYACSIVNLFLCGSFFDVALRDLGLTLGAVSLGRLAQTYDPF